MRSLSRCMIIIVMVLMIGGLPPMASALYTVVLPANTLFAEDFNEFSNNIDLRAGIDTSNINGCPSAPSTHICVGKYGWSWYDNAQNGYAHVSNNNSYSPTLSMEMQSPNTFSGAKFDIHHLVPTLNTTRIVTLSAYFAFDNFTRNGAGGNNELTFSLETWDFNFRYECVIAIFPAAAVVQVVSDDSLPSSGNYLIRLAAYDDTRMIASTGNWHHILLTCDISNHKYVGLVVDNMDILSAIPAINAKTNSIADTEMLVGSTQFTRPLRVEMAMLNNPTSAFHIWHKWTDDVVVTDVTTIPTQSFFAANELWKAVAAMGSMMSVVTMYSSVRAYQEPDPLRRRMKLMVAVVFAVGAGTLAVFAIILSRL